MRGMVTGAARSPDRAALAVLRCAVVPETRRPSRRLGAEVAEALAARRAVVALETTVLAHGLPRDEAIALSDDLDAAVRAAGAVPAFVGVIEGVAVVGLTAEETRSLVEGARGVPKLAARDLGPAVAAHANGATTVSATISLATSVGVEVMATGGIGGVHLGASETYDESADLFALSTTPCLVVASGAKSVLDVGATLERLESLAVPVVGYRTSTFPWFYLRDSGLPLRWIVESPRSAATAFAAHLALGSGGMLLANPVPAEAELDPSLHASVLADALHEAHEYGVTGSDVTPRLLAHFATATGGRSVATNLALLQSNARLAADVAVALVDVRDEG